MERINLAAGKTAITLSANQSTGTPSTLPRLTDGDKATANYIDVAPSNDREPVKITLDLGYVCSVDEIKVWHYFGDSRVYNDAIVEVSTDGINWVIIYDSKVSGTYTETSGGKSHGFSPRKVRYVRDGIRGSNKNASNHWVELEVWGELPPEAPRNLAKGRITWSNSGNSTKTTKWRYLHLTDGIKSSTMYLDGGASNNGQPVKLTLDLGHVCSVSQINVWHYFADSRIYNNASLEVSEDGLQWETIFSGTYTETSAGKAHIFPLRPVRYVRDGIMGSNKNAGNHWVEIEVIGVDLSPDEVMKLPATADTFSNKWSTGRDANYGAAIDMQALSNQTYSGDYDRDLWMKFDVGTLLSAGVQQVRQAILRIYYYKGDIPDRLQQMEIYPILTDWDEMTLTYNNKPAHGSLVDVMESPTVSGNGYGWREADVTSLVNSWLLGQSNFGVRGDIAGNRQTGISNTLQWNNMWHYTREYNGGSHAPYIEVQYSPIQEDDQTFVFVQFM